MNRHVVVLVTAPSREVGSRIAEALLEQGLAACVNLASSVTSVYSWEGETRSDEEVLLVIKTRRAAFDELADAVRNVHPYEVPEIIALPVVAGSQDYLDWIDEVVEG
ncbi:MAG: divalent-cation tolerance protein CutA [Anaerolineae bacterium]